MARHRRIDISGEVPAVGATTKEPIPELDDVRTRRAGLKVALSGLEIALAAPGGHRDAWVRGVRESLARVHEVWTRHIVETEAPGAFLDELVSEAPRLATPASRLRREHNRILEAITAAELKADAPPDDDAYDTWVDGMRTECNALLVALVKHRQSGADLVYEAYDVDIGGGS